MKRTLIIITSILFIACSKADPPTSSAAGSAPAPASCGTYNGHTLYKGPQGGCYYIKPNGAKEYVDRSKCRC